MNIEDFPTRIHPFDMYGFLQKIDIVDVVKTSETVSLPVSQHVTGKIEYYDKQPIMIVKGRKFVQTTTVPVITEEGRKLR